MNETQRPRRILRSIGAVFAGFVVVVVLSLGTDVVLRATGVFPPWSDPMSDALFLLATVYRTLYAVLGSYLTARLAPHAPMKHALAGGVVGLVLSTVGAVTTWHRGPEFGPHWYPLALVATAMPCAWAGGRLRALQLPDGQR
jgi:drug/metabolite transporter (DMT)-like permease